MARRRQGWTGTKRSCRGAPADRVRWAWFAVAAALAGCGQPTPDPPSEPIDGLAALGLVPVVTPFAADGWTLCLPTEQGDDTLCEAPAEGTRLLLGPYDAPILGLHVVATWTPASGATRELVMTVLCHESGATDDPARCEDVPDLQVSGPSPLAADLVDLITPESAVLEVRVSLPAGAAGVPTLARQAVHWEGNVTTGREPDATNQG